MKYYIRLDDACDTLNKKNWSRMEVLLDRFEISPLVGIIPNCEDENLTKFEKVDSFWDLAKKWDSKGWVLALHGFNHLCEKTNNGGINPVHFVSEFVGLNLEDQKEKIRKGLSVFIKHGLKPEVFFAPCHTFDENTIKALIDETDIRIISDTIASKRYLYSGITFIPQQSGKVRKMFGLKEITFCYHPNEMNDYDFEELAIFIKKNRKKFYSFSISKAKKKKTIYDIILKKLYFLRRSKNNG